MIEDIKPFKEIWTNDINLYLHDLSIKKESHTFEEFLKGFNFFDEDKENGAILLSDNSLHKGLLRLKKEKYISPKGFVHSILYVANEELKKTEKILLEEYFSTVVQSVIQNGREKEYTLQSLGKNGDAPEGSTESNYEWMLRNKYRNWIRLILPEGQEFFGVKNLQYDDIHKRNIYSFTSAKKESHFAQELVGRFKNIIQGKVLGVIGDGVGKDTNYFLKNDAAGVFFMEQSPLMHKNAQNYFKDNVMYDRDEFFENRTKKVLLAESATDAINSIRDLKNSGKTLDSIIAHYSLHFHDDEKLIEILTEVYEVLSVGGSFAFAQKGMDAWLNGEGIQLTKDENEVTFNANLNTDGIIRYHRSLNDLEAILKKVGFRIDVSEKKRINSYGIHNTQQEAYYIIARKL